MAVLRVFALAAAFAAGAIARAEDAPRFVAARFDAAAGVVRFEAPVVVDWQAAARKHFRRFDFERPSAKDLDDLRARIWEISGDAEETFRFAPPRLVRRATYTLISSAGIAPLKAGALEGTIRFDFDHAKPANLTGTSYFGEAVSRRGQGPGGFALLSRHASAPVRIAGARGELERKDGKVALSYVDAGTRISLTLPERWHSTIETTFAFQVAGRRYLFVAWPPDTTGFDAYCASNFSLYAAGATLEEVAGNSYDCDV